jgi:hypothetical protein
VARPDRLDISIDHYRVLGVAVGADGASIRRAYLAAAREHHPDRVIGADAARRQLSDHKMRAANEAWRILGDADLKQQYDRERARAAAKTTSASSAARAAPTFVPTHDPSGGDFMVASPRVAAAMQYGPWFLAAVLALGIFIFTAYAATSSSQTGSGESVDNWVTVGECISLFGPGNYEQVPCDGPHDGVVDELRSDEVCQDPTAEPFKPRARNVVFCLVDAAPAGG